jgi:hypothetical protein
MADVPFAQQRVRVTNGQGSLTRRSIAILEDAGRELGLDLVSGVGQGSFCKDCVGASGGTHDGGGAFDLRGKLGLAVPKVEKALRERGVAAWIRLKTFKANGELLWPLHLHGIDAFDPELSPEAEGQVDQYKAGTDGLAGHKEEDTGRPHPKLVKFPDPLSEEEELMALSPETLKAISSSLLNAKIRKADGKEATVRGLLAFTHAHALAAEQEAIKARRLAELAAKRAGVIGADIDKLLKQAEAEAAAMAAHAAVTDDDTDDPDK